MRIERRRGSVRITAIGALLVAALGGGAAAGESSREAAARLYRESLAAYSAQDYAGFLAATKAGLAEDPESPRLLYNLACGQALTGEWTAAVETLERLARMGLAFDLDGETDLASVRGTPGYANALESMRALEWPVGAAERAFTLDDPHFIPEGIARDPADGSFYLGSVRKRAIVRIGKDGRTERVSGPEAGLDSVLGMAIDARRRVLWVCTSALPAMEGFREEDAGRASLVRFDLAGGRPRAAGRFELPPVGEGDSGEERVCNDLAVGPGGEVYVADSAGGGLFRLPAGGAALEPVVPAGTFRSPNGLVVTGDGRRLYVADYALGLYAVDAVTGTATPFGHPADLVLRGIDGLAAVPPEAGRPESLVAIQNGVRPHRVVRLDLAAGDADRWAGDVAGEAGGAPAVVGGTVLLRGHPDFDEPTLGLVAPSSAGGNRRSLYLVANSHWNRFAADHSLPPAAELTPPVVLELPLPPVGPLARRGFLGVAVARAEAGLNVTRVIPGSTAAAVGFEPDDRILVIDGREVGTPAEFVAQVGGRRAGERVAFRFRRGETVEERTAELTPFPREEVPGSRVSYEQVTVDGGARLRTVVTRPAAGAGPFPVLLLLDGLSCSTIDRPFAGEDDAFVHLAHVVAASGYATMRLERSGVGDSEGPSCSEVNFAAELGSYRAALATLRRDPSIDPSRIFVFGISMGGVMAPLLDAGRAEGPPLAGIAVYGTILKSFFEYLVENRRRQLPRDGLDPVAGEESVRRHDDFMARFILDGLTPGEVAARYPDLAGAVEEVDDTHFFRRPAAYFHQLQRRHLAAAWAAVGAAGTRVLALHGEYDWVSARDDHEAIAAITGGRFVELPGLDHGITAHPSLEASYEHYARGEPSGAVAEALVAWLGEPAGGRPAAGG